MRVLVVENGKLSPVTNMSYLQTRQSIAIMDCIGRLIPQEGVDYEAEVIFKGDNDSSVSMNIKALTDKGEWWKKYVAKMVGNYPPKFENPDEAIVEEPERKKEEIEVVDPEIVDA